jgi:hypothetical protein
MRKTVILQCPRKFIDVIPVFYNEANQYGIFDRFHLISDSTDVNINADNFSSIHHEDLGFSSNILKLLNHVDDDIFLLTCEDHILQSASKEMFDKAFDFVANNPSVGFLRLRCPQKIGPKDLAVPYKTKDDFSELHMGYKYYVCLQPAIWRRSYLQYCLREGEDAWSLEIKAAKRAQEHPSMRSFASRKIIYNFMNFYKEGKYIREEFFKYAQKRDIKLKNKYDIYRVVNGKPEIIPYDKYNSKCK